MTKNRVGTIELSGKHFLEISAFIEINNQGFSKDVIFFAIHKEFNRSNSISMQLRLNDIFAICESMKELITKNSTSFVKFTKSNNITSKLFFEFQGDKYYLKMIRNQNILSIGFDIYYFRAFYNRLISLAKYTERDLYITQKKQYNYKDNYYV